MRSKFLGKLIVSEGDAPKAIVVGSSAIPTKSVPHRPHRASGCFTGDSAFGRRARPGSSQEPGIHLEPLVLEPPTPTKPGMAITSFPSPTPEDTEELLLIARYGELDELKSFIEKFGAKPLTDARDEDGNTILHMVCGNGHLGAIQKKNSVQDDEGGHSNVHFTD